MNKGNHNDLIIKLSNGQNTTPKCRRHQVINDVRNM